MCRDTWVTGSRVDVARALRPVWRNDTTRRRLLRPRQSGPHDRKHERESKHKIDSCFHSYPDLLGRFVLSSEETEPLRLWGPVYLNFLLGYVYHLAMNSIHLMAQNCLGIQNANQIGFRVAAIARSADSRELVVKLGDHI